MIRWLCEEPRLHLRQTLFFVHTHNTMAGLLMVLQMRESGYQAEFRPFGVDLAELLAANEPHESEDADRTNSAIATLEKWFDRLQSLWSYVVDEHRSPASVGCYATSSWSNSQANALDSNRSDLAEILDGASTRLELDLSTEEIAKDSGGIVSWAVGGIS